MLNPYQVQKTLEITEQFYGTASHPEQIPIIKDSFDKLMSLHPEAIKLKADENGEPLSWVVVIPTGKDLMEKFLKNEITEKELFDRAVEEKKFEALYLCSAFTIPEYRGKGYAKELLKEAINEFAPTDTIPLYGWIYSKEGEKLVKVLGQELGRKIKTKNE